MRQAKLPLTAAHEPDHAKIAAIVSERHGIVIPPDDPAWVIVTMNELVLRAVAAEYLAATRKLMVAHIAELHQSARPAQTRCSWLAVAAAALALFAYGFWLGRC